MCANKTKAGATDPLAFIATVKPDQRREDAMRLLHLFREASGFEPKMWGAAMIGFGRYNYRYKTGREGDFLATGFSPRQKNMSLYIMPGYQDYGSILDRLGPYKKGKSCVYITRLDQIDTAVLTELIQAGLRDLAALYPVYPE